MSEMKSLTLNGKKYDSFVDLEAREAIEEIEKNGTGGTVTDEQIADAVEDYMAEHPIEIPDSSQNAHSGMSQTLRVALYNLLMDAAYQSSGHEADKAALAELLTGGSVNPDVPDTPDEPDEPVIVYYTIEKTLTNVSISNGTATVAAGSAYSATLTADSGYILDEVTVTMGGVAVSVIDGMINIESVSGNIVIVATATANSSGENPDSVGWTNGQVVTEVIEGETINRTTGQPQVLAGYRRTDYVYIYGARYLKAVHHICSIAFYDIGKGLLSIADPDDYGYLQIPENAAYAIAFAHNSYPLESVTILGDIEATWQDGVPYQLELTDGKYLNGAQVLDYAGWSVTQKLNCYGAKRLECSSTFTVYGSFYDTTGAYCGIKSAQGKSIDVPDRAAYFAYSGANATMQSITITPYAE